MTILLTLASALIVQTSDAPILAAAVSIAADSLEVSEYVVSRTYTHRGHTFEHAPAAIDATAKALRTRAVERDEVRQCGRASANAFIRCNLVGAKALVSVGAIRRLASGRAFVSVWIDTTDDRTGVHSAYMVLEVECQNGKWTLVRIVEKGAS